MTEATDRKAELRPILEQDIARAALFLHRHMNDKFSAEDWERGMRAGWLDSAPNYGFMLESNGEVVGALCTLYSEQVVNGETRLICNPHTWCVLEPYRAKSVSLVLSAIRQPGMHFTMFSPNREGEEIFSYLGFKPLPRDALVMLNIPGVQPFRAIRVGFTIDGALDALAPEDKKCVQDHRGFEWLQFLFYSHGERHGFLIYKKCRYKRLPCAQLMYISDKALFRTCWVSIRSKLLVRRGIFSTRAEQRLIGEKPSFSFPTVQASAKFYLSDTLPPDAFNYTYSELVALDL